VFARKIALLQHRIRGRDPHRDAVKAIRRLNRRQLVAAINSYYWWHSIDLGGGITTPGQKSIELMQTEFANTFSKVDLKGKSVLDIGAWNGGFSVEAVRRGAGRVVALDHYTWNHEFFKGRETFELVCRIAGMDIDAVDIDLDESQLNLSRLGKFDVVLFLGVFYHLRNPLAALGQLALLTRELLIVETHIEHTADPRPLMVFYPGAELGGDATNWWGPNTACMMALLQALGFGRIKALPGSDPNRQIFHAYRAA
jgi:tRNA (mo5U34)-methyltransferase